MRNYSLNNQWQKLLTPDIVALLTQIHEFKGEQNLFIEANSDSLTQLLEIAKIQSTEASNKIEGIYTSDERLKKIVLDKTTPQTRNEQEIAGYRDVLATIHESYEYIPLCPSMILQLHRDLYKFRGMNIGGSYKYSGNMVTDMPQSDSLLKTADEVDLICKAYDEAVGLGADPLLAIPMFILDFLCVHPFNDGNGRMSRLLTLLLLYRSGYIVGKYISIERVIEQSKETYYETLQQSSVGWHENENDYAPFVRYLLGTVVAAYRDFSSRVQLLVTSGMSKPERIRELIKNTLGKITKTEIMEKCPDISQATVQRTLNELQKKNEILKLSGGRYTAYIWNRENE